MNNDSFTIVEPIDQDPEEVIFFLVESNQDNLIHHCGVVGVFSEGKINVPEKIFYSLFSLQHRGQESAGLAYRKENRLVTYKDLGMVSSVLSHYLEAEHPSNIGIGHVRYSTSGANLIENAQPIHVTCNKGDIALAHNGNISNASEIMETLVEKGTIFQSTSDTELILHLLAQSRKKNVREALKETLLKLEGAYSMVMIHEETLIAMRDPHGFRPLYIGRKGSLTAVASETCALDMLDIVDYREVEPGEIIIIDKRGFRSEHLGRAEKLGKCVFELIYFARPDSLVFDESVYAARKKMGAALAKADTEMLDAIDRENTIVVPVPTSGNTAALGYAQASGIPFEIGLTRNHYVGRSFIMPSTAQRELVVKMKLHPVKEIIKGKTIILIDDSLVRGTTSKILVQLLKDAGAAKVHLRLSSPEIKWPCYFGIDVPTRSELISNSLTNAEIAQTVGANTVKFLNIQDLNTCVRGPEDYCTGCFNGNYPIPVTHTEEDI